MQPGSEIWKHTMSILPYPNPELAERMYITSSWDEFHNITKYQLLKKEKFFIMYVRLKLQGTHAKMASLLFEFVLKWPKEFGTAWYKSKEPVPIVHPFVGDGYLSNKKWPLIEECTIVH